MTRLPVLVQGVDLQKGSTNVVSRDWKELISFLFNACKTNLRSVVYKLAFLIISCFC